MSVFSKSYFRGYISTIWKDHLPIHWTNTDTVRSWPKCKNQSFTISCGSMWVFQDVDEHWHLYFGTVLRSSVSLRTSRERARSWLHPHPQNWPLWIWRASFILSRGRCKRRLHIHVKRRNSSWLSLNFSYNRRVLYDTTAFQSIKNKVIPALAYHLQKCSYLLCNT